MQREVFKKVYFCDKEEITILRINFQHIKSDNSSKLYLYLYEYSISTRYEDIEI